MKIDSFPCPRRVHHLTLIRYFARRLIRVFGIQQVHFLGSSLLSALAEQSIYSHGIPNTWPFPFYFAFLLLLISHSLLSPTLIRFRRLYQIILAPYTESSCLTNKRCITTNEGYWGKNKRDSNSNI